MSQLDLIYHHCGSDLDVIRDTKEISEVRKFYAGKTIFITGATGFMGKCLVEKLLRSCSNLRRIYLLVREKKGISIEDRLKKYFRAKIFSKLMDINPNVMRKVIGIKGDISVERCGLSDDDIDLLQRETNIIYHVAANVEFTAKVAESLRVNTLATKYIVDLAEKCQNLEVFIYFSTAYSHCYMKCITEELYESPGDLELVHKMIEIDERIGIDETALREWIGKYPNIYTFSKAISEELVRQHSLKATHACGIYRPSIVVSTYEEPIAGWQNGFNGASIVGVAYGLGLFHVAMGYGYPMDFIPCDMAINIVIALTKDLDEEWKRLHKKEAIVYNYGSSCVNPTNFEYMARIVENLEGRMRSRYAVFMNFLVITSHWWIFWILDKLFHFLPACLADFVLLLTGRKTRAVHIYRTLHKHMDEIDYWGNGNWRIHMKNSLRVANQLNTIDRELFFCDLTQIDWDEFTLRGAKGGLIHILREEIPNKEGERRYLLLCIAYYGIIYSFFFILLYSTSKFLL